MTMSLPEALTADAPSMLSRRSESGRRERIRVVFVIDNMRFGGTELNAVRTAERLDRKKFELRVVCLSEDGPLTERYRAIGVPVVNLGLRSFYGPSMFACGLRFVRLLRREPADVLHAHDMYSNIFAAAWGRLARVPVLVTSRRWWNSLPNWKLRAASRFAVARSTAVLANSSAVAGLVVTEAPRAAGKVWTITNFVDEAAFGSEGDEERCALRKEWSAPDDAVVIGCVSRLDPLKDHASLLRAFALVRAEKADVFLVLIGDGERRTSLGRLATELKIDGAMHFAGEVRGRDNLHRGFDISVLASLSEGFPNTLVEAMAAGVPVVSTAVGGSVDAVVDGKTGLLVPPGNPEALAEALLRLSTDRALRKEFGFAGEQRARALFHASGVLSSLDRMYRALGERRR